MRPDAESRPVFRFAPSPNGRLHLGHAYSALLNAALASRTGGRLLLRIEDIDPTRSRPELIDAIGADLAWLGLVFDPPVRRQSQHMPDYRAARDGLIARGLAYPCFCTRGDIRAAAGGNAARDPDGAPLYPGTCRALDPETAAARRAAGEPHAWRLDMARAIGQAPGPHVYTNLALLPPPDGSQACPGSAPCVPKSGRTDLGAGEGGPRVGEGRERGAPFQASSLPSPDPLQGGGEGAFHEMVRVVDPARWGDAVIARRDVPTSYHLAVVVDDAHQGVTHVVRGRDLEAATDLHVLLQGLLGLPTPRYHHHALVLGPDGGKLAKSKGSESLADRRARGETPETIRAALGFA
ncbi:glutamate--tRNA ligase family protein [Methylobacterium sp. E-041]|uniref:glutamate--tRNA ligase family protein n=1 Tax=unclassified Methylobacterium TaxID=2615210 RepID=UPI001FBB5D83|nr:glutamate--tRNA ligase family protein [Methylobacterium sp. E-041]MCJ2104203.1 glutamate--tRNA ligase family protein [Methylobacterium sp. E-041]